MYNENHKQGFLKKIRSSDMLARQLFAASAPYEERYGKDICQFSADELDSFLREDFITGDMSLYRAVHVIKQYVRYCMHRKMDTETSYQKIKTDPVDEMRETLFASPLHLASKLDQAFSEIQEDNVDLLCRCFIWLAFAEMEDNGIAAVRRDDVDLMARAVHFNGRDYRIYEEAYPAFDRVYTLPSFKVFVQKGFMYQTRSNPDMFFSGMERGEYNPKLKLADFRARISAAAFSSGVPLSYNTIRMSGLFFRVYERERAGLVDDLESAFASFDARGAKTDGVATRQSTRRTTRGVFEKYSAWKKAFEV